MKINESTASEYGTAPPRENERGLAGKGMAVAKPGKDRYYYCLERVSALQIFG